MKLPRRSVHLRSHPSPPVEPVHASQQTAFRYILHSALRQTLWTHCCSPCQYARWALLDAAACASKRGRIHAGWPSAAHKAAAVDCPTQKLKCRVTRLLAIPCPLPSKSLAHTTSARHLPEAPQNGRRAMLKVSAYTICLLTGSKYSRNNSASLTSRFCSKIQSQQKRISHEPL